MLIGRDSPGLMKQFINMKVDWNVNWKRAIYQTRERRAFELVRRFPWLYSKQLQSVRFTIGIC